MAAVCSSVRQDFYAKLWFLIKNSPQIEQKEFGEFTQPRLDMFKAQHNTK
jgi:hypothetical protein